MREVKTQRLYTIANADSFAWLSERADHSIEAVVTDPPYGILEYSSDELAKKKNGKGIWRLPQAYDGYQRKSMPRFTVLTVSDHARIKTFHDKLAPLLHRVLVPGGHVFLASHNLFTHLVTNAFLVAGFELRRLHSSNTEPLIELLLQRVDDFEPALAVQLAAEICGY